MNPIELLKNVLESINNYNKKLGLQTRLEYGKNVFVKGNMRLRANIVDVKGEDVIVINNKVINALTPNNIIKFYPIIVSVVGTYIYKTELFPVFKGKRRDKMSYKVLGEDDFAKAYNGVYATKVLNNAVVNDNVVKGTLGFIRDVKGEVYSNSVGGKVKFYESTITLEESEFNLISKALTMQYSAIECGLVQTSDELCSLGSDFSDGRSMSIHISVVDPLKECGDCVRVILDLWSDSNSTEPIESATYYAPLQKSYCLKDTKTNTNYILHIGVEK